MELKKVISKKEEVLNVHVKNSFPDLLLMLCNRV